VVIWDNDALQVTEQLHNAAGRLTPSAPRHEGRDPMTVLHPDLAESLKTLKLSGMLETLDARLAQAHGGDLGHLEFLQIPCDDEITRREAQSMNRRLCRARFETGATLENFDFTASAKLPAVQIRDLADGTPTAPA
jgi:DNA replication protein DnaC